VRYRKTLFFVRHILPALIVVGGLIPIIIEPRGTTLEGGLGVVGAGVSVWLFSFLYRISASGDVHRQAEDEARAYFDLHGHWPDEDGRQ
jgi:hypothetical protein